MRELHQYSARVAHRTRKKQETLETLLVLFNQKQVNFSGTSQHVALMKSAPYFKVSRSFNEV